MRKAILWGFVALYGCAAAPAYRSPAVPAPAAFRAVADSEPAPSHVETATGPVATTPADSEETAASASEYWDQLGDTTLSRLVHEVARANLDVQAARARVNAAHSDRVRSVLDLTPGATVSAGYSRQRFAAPSFPGATGVFPDQTIWSTSVDASWDLDVFGRIRHGVQARGALVDVAEEQLRDVQVTLTADLASAYFELRGAQEQLAVARQNADNQKQTLELTQRRLDAGRGSTFDTERAQAQLSSTLATIPAREAQVAAAQYRIGTLVGRSPSAVAQELDLAAPLPALPDVTPIANPETVVRYRPDVAAAERLAAAQGALVGAAKASYLPQVTIGGSAGYLAPEFNAVGDRSTLRYVIGPVITWPGLNLGRVKAEVDAASARERAARAQYSQAVLAAVSDVETSLSRYRAARVQVERLQEASAASERAADLARLRYSEGATDLLAVLDAQRTELDAQDRLAQGRTDAATAYAALYRAVGGR
ncbi:MAG TPA: efflux transporter outer membrane subunit [Gemmatimonadales bacterium]|nr:efflux transporter outer membrane subunit [Gemmatimonadales bacterium]